MTLISTSALRKITIVVLAVAIASFASAEIHKRFIIPRQQISQVQPTPSQPTAGGVPTPALSVDSFELIESITGTFQRWEKIPNSSDKFAYLTDSRTGESFPKVRVGFEFSSLFGDETGRGDATVFAVEKSNGEYDVLGYLKDFTSGEVDELIKPGDNVKIMLKKRIDKIGNLKDEDGNLLAHWFFIRRELGRE